MQHPCAPLEGRKKGRSAGRKKGNLGRRGKEGRAGKEGRVSRKEGRKERKVKDLEVVLHYSPRDHWKAVPPKCH